MIRLGPSIGGYMSEKLILNSTTPARISDSSADVVGQVNYGGVYLFSSTSDTPAKPNLSNDGVYYLDQGGTFKLPKTIKWFAFAFSSSANEVASAKISFDKV